jgi:hypothetical protein
MDVDVYMGRYMIQLPYKYRVAIAAMHFFMRLLDKIYEGEDIWGEETPWWDTQ